MDSAIRNLETNPYIGKPLRGVLSGKWSLRIGDFRIIYTIDERQKTVTLYSASHRRTAYK